VKELQPDLVLTDIRMPIMHGVAATKTIQTNFQATNVLVFTTFDDDLYIKAGLQNGAIGYLLKNTPSEELAVAIRAVDKGFSKLSPGIFKKLLTQFPTIAPDPVESIPPSFSRTHTQRKTGFTVNC
jgi:DNA-binding NarL/FixJ family response regulator